MGGPGGALRRTQVNENFRALRPHNRADKFITREKNNHQFFIYGPQCEKMRILGYSGGPGWPINNPDWAHLASQASSHLYQSTYKIWKQSDKDFLSYRENDEVSADAAADSERRLNHSIPRTYFVRGIKAKHSLKLTFLWNDNICEIIFLILLHFPWHKYKMYYNVHY